MDRAHLAPRPRIAPPRIARASGDRACAAVAAARRGIAVAAPFTGVLELQRTHGNARVGRWLAPATIQRTLGDEHDLASPRFAGDATLEACFDDEARLGPPAKGESVRKVQQALIDLGHDLGPGGADGDYGPKTASAVRTFKRDQRLGFEQFGDVGPGTMTRLDELFPPVPPPPPAPNKEVADEDDASCPFTPIALAAAVAERSPELAVNAESSFAVGDGPEKTPHLSIADSIKKFQEKVNIAGIATGGAVDRNITDRGQFSWSIQVNDAIEADLSNMAAPLFPGSARFQKTGREALRLINARQDASARLAELTTLANTVHNPDTKTMQRLTAPDAAGGAVHEMTLWAAFIADDTNALPNLGAARSFFALRSMKAVEKTACWSHATFVAQKLKKKGGLKPRDPAVKTVNVKLSADDTVRDRRPDPPGSARHKGDVFTQNGVSAAVAAMKAAIDGGQVLHARVLSGVGFGTNPDVPPEPGSTPTPIGAPPEEHSLLIIGFDGDTFVFSDPDAGVSNTPVPGFGELFFDGKRLSTAKDDADLPVAADGRHPRDDKRDQIIKVFTEG